MQQPTRRQMLYTSAVAPSLLLTGCSSTDITIIIASAQASVDVIVRELTAAGKIPSGLETEILAWSKIAVTSISGTITEVQSADSAIQKVAVITGIVGTVVTSFKGLSPAAVVYVQAAEDAIEAILTAVQQNAGAVTAASKGSNPKIFKLSMAQMNRLAQTLNRNDLDRLKLAAIH